MFLQKRLQPKITKFRNNSVWRMLKLSIFSQIRGKQALHTKFHAFIIRAIVNFNQHWKKKRIFSYHYVKIISSDHLEVRFLNSIGKKGETQIETRAWPLGLEFTFSLNSCFLFVCLFVGHYKMQINNCLGTGISSLFDLIFKQ